LTNSIFQTIDEGELEKILDTDNTMFTKDQVKGIMKEVDLDDTGNLDFLECLAVSDVYRVVCFCKLRKPR